MLKRKEYENSLGYKIIKISYDRQLNKNKVLNKEYKNTLLACRKYKTITLDLWVRRENNATPNLPFEVTCKCETSQETVVVFPDIYTHNDVIMCGL